MAHTVFCVRYKKEMEGLDEPPFDSEFGQKIYKNVSKDQMRRPGSRRGNQSPPRRIQLQ